MVPSIALPNPWELFRHVLADAPPPPPSPIPGSRAFRGLERVQLALGGLRYADVLLAEVGGACDIDEVRRAAVRLARAKPALRTWFTGHLPDGMRVVATPPDPLPVGIDRRTPEEVVEDTLNADLGGPQPAWKLVVVPSGGRTFLVLAVHHVLVDGRSLGRLMLDLLNCLGDPAFEPSSQDLSPPAPDLADGRWWARVGGPVARQVWAGRLREQAEQTPFQAPPVPAGEPLRTRFFASRLPRGLVSALRAEARNHGASVGGALNAAAWRGAVEVARARGAGMDVERRVPVEAMVDLRPLLPGSGDVGMYASGAMALAGPGTPVEAWSRARLAKEQVHRQVSLGLPALIPVVLDDLEDPVAWLHTQGVDPGRNGGSGAVVQTSNAGVWDGPARFGPWALRGLWSATAALRTGPALLVWLRTVGEEGCLSAIANGHALRPEDGELFLSVVRRELEEMASYPQ